MNEEILRKIKEKGVLLDTELFEMLSGMNSDVAGMFLDDLERVSGKIITKSGITKNFEYVQNLVRSMPGESKDYVENIFIKLGLSVEIRKEQEIVKKEKVFRAEAEHIVKNAVIGEEKKIEVKDFVSHFRARYQQLQRILVQRNDLQNLISVNKVPMARQNLSIIGIVTEKRINRNKNLMIKFEDLTGEINALVRRESDVFQKADELQLDDVVAVKASGSREMIFVHDIVYPDCILQEKTRFNEDMCVAFSSDIHVGNSRHLGKSFERFIEWLNSDDETARKVKYVFFAGDNIDGVGVFPGQESVLEVKSVREQYKKLAEHLRKIPKRITAFMCAGQHDAVRLAEPQPIIDKEHGKELYEIENLILVTNPASVKLIEKGKEFKILMYHGDSIHEFINNIQELKEVKAHKYPAKAVKHMLKRRHLAPTHLSAVYIPNTTKDELVIEETPDVVLVGEVHRVDVENYNGVLIITGGCWQASTPLEEKIGNLPEPAKVSVLNLRTRELKVFDFGERK